MDKEVHNMENVQWVFSGIGTEILSTLVGVDVAQADRVLVHTNVKENQSRSNLSLMEDIRKGRDICELRLLRKHPRPRECRPSFAE